MGNFKCLNLIDPLTNLAWINEHVLDRCLKIAHCENGDFVTICRCVPLNSSTITEKSILELICIIEKRTFMHDIYKLCF